MYLKAQLQFSLFINILFIFRKNYIVSLTKQQTSEVGFHRLLRIFFTPVFLLVEIHRSLLYGICIIHLDGSIQTGLLERVESSIFQVINSSSLTDSLSLQSFWQRTLIRILILLPHLHYNEQYFSKIHLSYTSSIEKRKMRYVLTKSDHPFSVQLSYNQT